MGTKGVLDYIVSWPIAAPRDAYRAGADVNPILGVLIATLLGVPLALLRFPLDVLLATFNYARARRRTKTRLQRLGSYETWRSTTTPET